MEIRSRYLARSIRENLAEKMVFVGDPRQVGKTTFALAFLHKGGENIRHISIGTTRTRGRRC